MSKSDVRSTELLYQELEPIYLPILVMAGCILFSVNHTIQPSSCILCKREEETGSWKFQVIPLNNILDFFDLICLQSRLGYCLLLTISSPFCVYGKV